MASTSTWLIAWIDFNAVGTWTTITLSAATKRPQSKNTFYACTTHGAQHNTLVGDKLGQNICNIQCGIREGSLPSRTFFVLVGHFV